jgi:hypothetical protein
MPFPVEVVTDKKDEANMLALVGRNTLNNVLSIWTAILAERCLGTVPELASLPVIDDIAESTIGGIFNSILASFPRTLDCNGGPSKKRQVHECRLSKRHNNKEEEDSGKASSTNSRFSMAWTVQDVW